MSRLVFRAMRLTFQRDRGALAMSLLLPVAVFLVFAAVFAGASGDDLRVRVAVADEVGREESRRLVRALAREPALELATGDALTAGEVRRRVRLGRADAGLVIRKEGRALSDLGGFGPAPLLILADPVRAVAAQVLAGQVQRAYFAALPDVALAGLTEPPPDTTENCTVVPATPLPLASVTRTVKAPPNTVETFVVWLLPDT